MMTLRKRASLALGLVGLVAALAGHLGTSPGSWAWVIVMGIVAAAAAALGGFLVSGPEQWLADLEAALDGEPARTPEHRPDERAWPELGRITDRWVRWRDQVQREKSELDSLLRAFAVPAAQGTNGTDGAARFAGTPAMRLRSLLDRAIREVEQAGARVVSSAADTAGFIERVATGAVSQADTITRTAAAVDGLSVTIDSVSQNAESAAEVAAAVREEARRGLDQVRELIEGMNRIRDHVQANGKKIKRLGDRSMEIGSIVETISGISARTDLLSLNASIESVRAGEHGRGFAVVAEEIRKLSERTAEATREIGALIQAIQADTSDSIRAMDEQTADVGLQVQLVNDAGGTLEQISEASERSARLVGQISASATEQVQATHAVVQAMQQISEVASQTRRSAEHTRQTMASLARLADQLDAPLAWFRSLPPVSQPGPRAKPAAHRARGLVPAAAVPAFDGPEFSERVS